jgi:hypothetical protein
MLEECDILRRVPNTRKAHILFPEPVPPRNISIASGGSCGDLQTLINFPWRKSQAESLRETLAA